MQGVAEQQGAPSIRLRGEEQGVGDASECARAWPSPCTHHAPPAAFPPAQLTTPALLYVYGSVELALATPHFPLTGPTITGHTQWSARRSHSRHRWSVTEHVGSPAEPHPGGRQIGTEEYEPWQSAGSPGTPLQVDEHWPLGGVGGGVGLGLQPKARFAMLVLTEKA